MTSYDTIILGSSPNALTAAAYLAGARKKVLVLEPSEHLGGACASTEFAKGYRGDTSFVSGRLFETIVKDLKLKDHGLEVIERNSLTSLLPGGKCLTLTSDREAAAKAITSLSAKDSARYKQFMQLCDLAVSLLKNAYTAVPVGEHPPTKDDQQHLSALIGQLKGFGKREMTEVMRLPVLSLRDLLEEWFESAELKGLLATAGIRGLTQGPFAGGTTFNLLHHLTIGDGYFRATAKGGVGAICDALATAAKSSGAEIRTKTGELKIQVTEGTATAVQVGAEVIEAQTILSDYDARYTFTKLVPAYELEPEFNRSLQHLRYKGSVARINLALRELPKFTALSDKAGEDALRGTLHLAPSLAYLEKAFDSAKRGEVSADPILEVTIPSLNDASLAPAGKHVMSIWMQYVPHSGKFTADRVRDLAIENLNEHAPNLKSLVEHSQVILPAEFESRYNLSEGQLYGSEMNLAQAFYLRPVPGFAQYRSPIANLFMCGAATHPGGGVSGLPGRNAARELGVRDMVHA